MYKWTQYSINTHTNLDADWLVGFLPVEQPLGVKDRVSCVFVDWRANFLSFTTNYHIGV